MAIIDDLDDFLVGLEFEHDVTLLQLTVFLRDPANVINAYMFDPNAAAERQVESTDLSEASWAELKSRLVALSSNRSSTLNPGNSYGLGLRPVFEELLISANPYSMVTEVAKAEGFEPGLLFTFVADWDIQIGVLYVYMPG